MLDPVLLGGVLALVAASVAHELTHAAVAVALGGSARVDWWSLDTAYALPGDGEGSGARRRAHYAVLLAPFGVGVAGAGAWVLVAGLPAVGPRSALYALAWALYALGGGFDDFRIQPLGNADEAPDPGGRPADTPARWLPSLDLAEHTTLLLWSLAAFGVGWLVHRVGGLAPVRLQAYLGAAASGLLLAAVVLLGWSVLVYDRDRRGEDAILPPSGD